MFPMGNDTVARVAQTIGSFSGWSCEISPQWDFDILLKTAPADKIAVYGSRIAVEFPLSGQSSCMLATVYYQHTFYQSRVLCGSADTVIVMTKQDSWLISRAKLSNLLLARQGIADPELAVLTMVAKPMCDGVYGVEVPYNYLDMICFARKATGDLIGAQCS
jgi:hypothetical protein